MSDYHKNGLSYYKTGFYGLLLGTTLLMTPVAQAATTVAEWNPISSEKLIRMPSNYMDKALTQDFRNSDLSRQLIDVNDQIGLKSGTLSDLKAAIDAADGELRVELRHQYLEEKTRLLELMAEQGKARSAKQDIQIKILERALDKVQRDKSIAADPVRQDLVKRQQAARERLDRSLQAVDQVLYDGGTKKDSKYNVAYTQNLSKIEALKNAINRHAANASPVVDGHEVTREEFMRQLLAEARSEKALLDQEKEMRRYMARMVALDAQALEQELTFAATIIDGEKPPTSVADTVDHFIN